ncbi:MAG: hypothetical protein IKM61_07385 [Eubacteriaceae bacterium]|nr:hypothetical protein [Eubacteriaceae bacterium]
MEDNKDNLALSEELPEETAVNTTEETDETVEVTEEVSAETTPEEVPEENVPETASEETQIAPVNNLPEVKEEGKKEKKKKEKKGTGKKILKAFGIFLFIAFLAFSGFVGYKVWDYLQVYVYTTQHPFPATFESETLSLTVDNIELIDEILGFEMDENYVYLGVKYTYTNKSEAPIEWQGFPLLMVREFVRDEEDTGYILVENTDQPFEMTGLRNYAIDLELDLRPSKDALEAGQSRTTADIFRILKTDYEAKKYFLTTDLFNEIVNLPELPAEDADVITDTDSTVTE